jgi:hypothetical protein
MRSPVLQRVPSPQELVAHTQAILQTALIKRKLEDQKERYLKKQQERLGLIRIFLCSSLYLSSSKSCQHSVCELF